ncbi:uncharacterized protein LOC127988117 [Carassius gibelio]|uniref:uncharacterized protein LOC127988117 n=1 Tax=Carassius gibelio TaxID=101364 RepID=UPI002279D04E|nr:uncharacterized protein LOC127988117 [Carassius gibelio]
MFDSFIFICLFSLSLLGVSGVDVVKSESESVMEGDSVTLRTDVTEILKHEEIDWRFGKILIANINMKENKSTLYNTSVTERFRGRLKLDQTGSLIIMNTRTTDSGEYKVTSISRDTPLITFNLTVYARLPVPVISSNTSQNSSSSGSLSGCVFVCSVVNVSAVTLSWYKGNSLLSSISVSDLSRSLSLHLECLDDFYSCVVNNPIRNQTTHLNTQLCQTCSAAVGIFCIWRKHRKTDQEGNSCI